jgi:hypothetical protein
MKEQISDIAPHQMDSANKFVCIISHHNVGLTTRLRRRRPTGGYPKREAIWAVVLEPLVRPNYADL